MWRQAPLGPKGTTSGRCVLILKRTLQAGGPLAGMWTVPGGKNAPGEPWICAAAREAYKGAGIDAPPGSAWSAVNGFADRDELTPARVGTVGGAWRMTDMTTNLTEAQARSARIAEPGEFTELQWANLATLERLNKGHALAPGLLHQARRAAAVAEIALHSAAARPPRRPQSPNRDGSPGCSAGRRAPTIAVHSRQSGGDEDTHSSRRPAAPPNPTRHSTRADRRRRRHGPLPSMPAGRDGEG